LKNCVALLGAQLTYHVHVVCVRQGQLPMEGNGQDNDIKIATESAFLELLNKLKPECDVIRVQAKFKKQAIRKEQLLLLKNVSFHPLWVPTLTLHLMRGEVNQVSEVKLHRFVMEVLRQADEAKYPLVVGMDTEGQHLTKERPFSHAHYMQLAAGSNNECVVFRTTKANLEIALALFLNSNIIIAVAGKNEDCGVLKKIFSQEDTVWMERIEDIQLLGMKAMGLASVPKLEAMCSFMWKVEPPLTKFLLEEGKDTRDKAYACFDDDTVEALAADMLLYAALDAMAAKALYEHFASLLADPEPAESTEATKASAVSAPQPVVAAAVAP
jgi:hypothetical protein